MQIICPHCTTSYAVDPAKFGYGGRTVRCARCHETWLARPEGAEMTVPARDHVFAAQGEPTQGWDLPPAATDWPDEPTPRVNSPSIADGWPQSGRDNAEASEGFNGSEAFNAASDTDWPAEDIESEQAASPKWLPRFGRRAATSQGLARLTDAATYLRAHVPFATPRVNLNVICTIMAALVFALVVWRADVVRLMPQTGEFFKIVGLDVNLRGLAIEGMKITTETVNGKPVLVIEGAINAITRKPAELPRLRFIVRDAQGADIYAWNSVLEQTALKPGETIWFKSRLASPPAEGREIAVRFFQRSDIATGGV